MVQVLVPVVAFTLLLASGFGRDPQELPSELLGKRAPTFTLPRLGGGERIDLASLRGQIVVVNFWASWCLACRDEHPDLLAAWDRYPSVSDPSGSLAFDYELIGFPTTFIIDAGGTIRYRLVGYLSEDVLEAALDDVLSKGTP